VDSSPAFEAKGEPLGKSGLSDRALRAFDVVAHAVKLEGRGVNIPNAVARRRETVPRLADAAWIDERRTGESKGIDPVFVRHSAIRKPKDPRHVRVTMKADPAVKQLEVRVCHRGVEHVFINMVARTGVTEQNVVFEMAVW
jgi:hypothetical protein